MGTNQFYADYSLAGKKIIMLFSTTRDNTNGNLTTMKAVGEPNNKSLDICRLGQYHLHSTNNLSTRQFSRLGLSKIRVHSDINFVIGGMS